MRGHGAGLIAALILLTTPLPAEELTLDQAVRLSLEHNRAMERERTESRKIAERVAALRTRRFPTIGVYVLGSQLLTPIDFTLSQGLLGVYNAAGPIPGSDIPVHTGRQITGFLTGRVVQPLSGLYRIGQNLRLLDIAAEIEAEQTRQQQQELIRNVKKLYYGIQQAEGALRATHEAIGVYRELQRLTSQYAAQEAVLRADQTTVELNLAKAEHTELTAGSQQTSAKQQLNLLIGRDVLTDYTVSAAPEIAEFESDAATLRDQALRNRPEIRQAQLRTKLAAQDIRAKKSELIPDVNAEFNNLSFLGFNQFLPAHITTVGISLSWDIIDWGRKKHELREKELIAEQARSAALDTAASVTLEVEEKLRQLRLSRSRLRVTALGREAALENVRVVTTRFRVEAALMKDVLQGQAALQQATAEQEQARLEFWSAKADLERATGDIQ